MNPGLEFEKVFLACPRSEIKMVNPVQVFMLSSEDGSSSSVFDKQSVKEMMLGKLKD